MVCYSIRLIMETLQEMIREPSNMQAKALKMALRSSQPYHAGKGPKARLGGSNNNSGHRSQARTDCYCRQVQKCIARLREVCDKVEHDETYLLLQRTSKMTESSLRTHLGSEERVNGDSLLAHPLFIGEVRGIFPGILTTHEWNIPSVSAAWHAPKVLLPQPSPGQGPLVSLSAPMGSPTRIGIRVTWTPV